MAKIKIELSADIDGEIAEMYPPSDILSAKQNIYNDIHDALVTNLLARRIDYIVAKANGDISLELFEALDKNLKIQLSLGERLMQNLEVSID